LAIDLQKEFPGMKGFSVASLWRMKLFCEEYSRNTILAPLVREISWSHNVVIMEKCKNNLEREFYIRMTRKNSWTKNVLIHQIEGKAYEHILTNQTNFNKTVPAKIRHQAKLAIKDEYAFDFLELGEQHTERQLEKAVLSRMSFFLNEMGGAISFLGSQYRLEVGGQEYFVDILLYHRYLRSLIALEFKVGEFLPEYVGKMQFYLTTINKHLKAKGENPPIGIIVCKSKNKTVVEYALQDVKKPIGVSTYRITTRLPKNLKKELPAPEQVVKLLAGV